MTNSNTIQHLCRYLVLKQL